MPEVNRKNGYAIALAWPETYCKQAGAWYDKLMSKMGVSINYHYQVGHAAVILVDGNNGNCHYFDFGRYHAPYGNGRVRNKETDHDLTIQSKATINREGTITNINEILSEVYHNPSCHGTGPVHAAITGISFGLAYKSAQEMQNASPWKYGPFIRNGTNCSRFVRSIILSGKPALTKALRLKFPLTLSPTPLGIVKLLGWRTVFGPVENLHLNDSQKLKPPSLSFKDLKKTLQIPLKGPSIPSNAQWLAGEGAGSWFHIEQAGTKFRITRYNEQGDQECEGLYERQGKASLTLTKPYEFIHLSHCDQVTIKQYGKTIYLKRIKSSNSKQKYDPYSNMLSKRAS